MKLIILFFLIFVGSLKAQLNPEWVARKLTVGDFKETKRMMLIK
ncbi:MAG: hypothetical protein WAT71_08810 [Ignavibacteria bacterium]